MAENQDELERDIRSAECEFLAEAPTDDEDDNAGATDDDDVEFDEQLELAGEITLCTGSACLLYTSPSPRDATLSRMPSSA